jgi:hypothetical protein
MMLPLRRDEVLRTPTVRGLWTFGWVEQQKTACKRTARPRLDLGPNGAHSAVITGSSELAGAGG